MYHSKRSECQGDRVCDGERGNRHKQNPAVAYDEDEGKHEQQMVIAEQNVFNAVPQVGARDRQGPARISIDNLLFR